MRTKDRVNKMSLFVCKYVVFFTLFFPVLCSAETPTRVTVPQTDNGAALMVGKKSAFPVKTFDLNSETDTDALMELYDARESKVETQAELGIHGIYSVRKPEDIPKIRNTFDEMGRWLSVFEIRIMNDIKTTAFVPITAADGQPEIVVSGASDSFVAVTGISFVLTADAIHVHHLKWGDMGIKTALTIDAKESLTLDHLMLSDSKYEDNFAEIAEPRVVIRSNAEDGNFTNATLSNISFKNNNSRALLFIEDESLDKFGTMTLDHLTLANNKTITMGIDVSAAKKAIITDTSISGQTGSAVFVQRTPLGEVTILNSKIPDEAYQYVPISQYKDKVAKPVKIGK